MARFGADNVLQQKEGTRYGFDTLLEESPVVHPEGGRLHDVVGEGPRVAHGHHEGADAAKGGPAERLQMASGVGERHWANDDT